MITATDLFAGAGGSTTGAEQAGAKVVIAANHWRLAVDTHQANHPQTAHDCADISQVDPRRYPRTHLLLGSPECTWHSPASGRKQPAHQADLLGEAPLPPEAGERSRATMWDIPRFAEHHRYPIVIVENVVEAMTLWPPARAWLMAMDSLGYHHEVISHNSMHAQAHGLPAPQSRDRIYVVFWSKKMPRPAWDSVQRPAAWCPRCEKVTEAAKAWKQRKGGQPIAGKYRSQYLYACSSCGTTVEPAWLPASSAIDWSLPAARIGDRARPLSDKTMARIREGLRRYGAPHIIDRRFEYRARNVGDPLRTVTTRENHGLLVPYYGSSASAQPATDPIGTLTTRDRYALVMLRGANAPKPVGVPLDTVAASGNHHGLMSTDMPDVEDCRFRMLEPHEITAGMAFPDGYRMLGTKRDQVKLAGNAVTPPVERDLVAVAIEALGGAA